MRRLHRGGIGAAQTTAASARNAKPPNGGCAPRHRPKGWGRGAASGCPWPGRCCRRGSCARKMGGL
eukprot:11177175-Lingulodinium_polyedra.AAC.1